MTMPRLIMLCGISGSGKTTYAKRYVLNPNTIHLSSDSIRAELYGDESIQSNPGEVFSLMQSRAIEALNTGKDVIYDATNITRKDRSGIISVCPKFAKIECHIIWSPIEICIERDAARERTVGKEVIDKMLKRFQTPWYDEGINEIKIITTEQSDGEKYYQNIVDQMRIPHDNPHHTLNILEHCIKSADFLKNEDPNLQYAALWHDCGKPYVKSFANSKGELTTEAHYYGHQGVSAWCSYGLPYDPGIKPTCEWKYVFNDILIYRAWLISTHMDPFLNTKYYNNLPPFLKKPIDMLHEADLAAH